MVQNALKNQACDLNVLNEVTGKFLNNSTSPESVADTIIRICTLNNVENTIMQSFGKIKNINLSDILQHIITKIEDTSTAITISNFVTLACNNLNLENAYQLLIRCLEISFNQINQTNNSIECLEKIKNHTAQLSKSKKEFIPVLKSGFTSTTSDDLKKTILDLVRFLKIKPQFKKDLTGDDLEFYNKEIG